MKLRFLTGSFFFILFITTLLSFSNSSQGSLQDVLSYTNKFRKSRGLGALIMRDDLNAIAQQHSKNMASGKTEFGHDGFNKRELQAKQLIKNANSFAENVAYGAADGKEAVDGWKKSPGHRRNMLGPYRYIGIGIAADRHGRLYYTQFFVN